MSQVKKLIEAAMPVKEISAESVRDKSIRHGHISTLHLWWARRPLPVCRAVVFASLVPDPLDPHCPEAFIKAIKELLGPGKEGLDFYKPYEDIPYTSVIDPMEDNPRNRLMMFIGKFSETFLKNEQNGKKTAAKDMISGHSLIKWDNKNNKDILTIARKLIWVAHDPQHNTLTNYDDFYNTIDEAEKELYSIPDRHKSSGEIKEKEQALSRAIEAFQERMPKVFDPFAGGGAIPLEAARLGCKSYANDINPVAHIIEKGSLEFPQKYGKPIVYSKDEFINRYGKETFSELQLEKGLFTDDEDYIKLENRLAFDVEYYAKKLLRLAEEEIGHLYPADEKGNKPVAYYWARVATCSNPSCGAEVPLLRDFYLVDKKDKKIHLYPIIQGKKITFEIKAGKINQQGWNQRATLVCPCCGNVTGTKILKEQFVKGETSTRMLAVIWESSSGKQYKLPTERELTILEKIPLDAERPYESMDNGNYRDLKLPKWGLQYWAEMFSNRQLLAMQTLINNLADIKVELKAVNNNYGKAVATYLGILIDRIAIINTSFGRLHTKGEKLEHPFSRQAIPMVFDFPESNPFCTSAGSALNQLNWILRYINDEKGFPAECKNSASGDNTQFPEKYLSTVVTDPPYYDAIAYADLSDFFYVWLKRSIADIYPATFAYPQTPKSDECTALKHHHGGNLEHAKTHFENKLQQIFDTIEKQTKGVVSIMFAHQSTEAWTTLCNSILNARMNITSSWAIDTELENRMIAMEKAALASSVTVSCRPAEKEGYGDFKTIKLAIDVRIKDEVQLLYKLGFRGADLLTACFGQAVSEFGRYEKVEKADGTEVSVAELLDTAKNAAFNAIVSDVQTDEVTRFYIGWLNLFSFSEAEHDDVRRFTQIGLNIDIDELIKQTILIRNGTKESIAGFSQRIEKNVKLGDKQKDIVIDKAHKLMYLYGSANRGSLVKHVALHAEGPENIVWRVINSLVEVLPHSSEDYKAASGLLANKESLIREAKKVSSGSNQPDLFHIISD